MARREREALHETLSGIPVDPLYSPSTTPLDYARALGDPGTYPYTRGRLRDDAPRPAVDDAHVRGVRHGGRDQRALPLPARAGPDRPLDRLRHADADGLRLRRAAGARRGRTRGRGDRHAGRHGGSVRGHPARRGDGVDDRQRARRDGARDVRLRGAAPRHPAGQARRHDPDGHPQGVHRPEGMDLPARAVDAASSST